VQAFRIFREARFIRNKLRRVNVSDDERERNYLTETEYMQFEADYKFVVDSLIAGRLFAPPEALSSMQLNCCHCVVCRSVL
jgi:hypothetical protein